MRANTFTLTFLLALCFSSVAYGQAAKYGKVEDFELKMTHYAQDTSADAIILSDYGNTKFLFRHKVQVIMERHIRIKILKKSGYDWANFEVPYYLKGLDKEAVTSVKGVTYTLENGEVHKTKLESKAVFEEKQSDSWYAKKFTMPNVKVGSVIDVAYTITSDFVYNLREWEFQTTIPTLWSEYRAEIPSYYDYKFLIQGYHPLHNKGYQNRGTTTAELTNNAYTWVMKDVPALKEERYITSLKDYQSKIEFELEMVRYPNQAPRKMTGNWNDVNNMMLSEERFGKQLGHNSFLRQEIAAIVAKHQKPELQAEAIYNHVKQWMTWNKKYGYMTTTNIRKAYDARVGNSADINLLLTAMLEEAGMEASPVLISTRDNGRPPQATPLVNKFNYVITHLSLGGKEYLLDATEPLLPFGVLPVRALNNVGRLIRKNDHRWVNLTPGTYSQFITSDLTLKPDGEMTGSATESAGGYYALSLRKTLLDEGEDKFAERLAREVGDYTLGKPVVENKDNIADALNIKYSINSGGNGQVNNIIYLNPMLGHGEKENPFKLSERLYPVDFASPVNETIITKYTLPAGYVVDEAPKNISVMLPGNGGRFMYMVQQDGNVLQVMSSININKPLFYAQEYAHLKEFYNQIIAKHAEQIVLKKAN